MLLCGYPTRTARIVAGYPVAAITWHNVAVGVPPYVIGANLAFITVFVVMSLLTLVRKKLTASG